jgi:hypothetical protein
MNQLDQFFPGSTTPLNFEEIIVDKVKELDSWDYKPYTFLVGGVETEFFSIGQLGKALGGRSPNTLRAWEREGIIGKSPYVKPSSTPNGRRRMYTREMVEGLVAIAREEGILWPHKGSRISNTKFSERAIELFRRLRLEQKQMR